MKWIADENVDLAIVERMRAEGETVHYVCEMESGTEDEQILDLAANEAAILLTADKDFGELVFRQGRASAGVVLLRLPGLSSHEKADVMIEAVSRFRDELESSFSVITRNSVRIRRSQR